MDNTRFYGVYTLSYKQEIGDLVIIECRDTQDGPCDQDDNVDDTVCGNRSAWLAELADYASLDCCHHECRESD